MKIHTENTSHHLIFDVVPLIYEDRIRIAGNLHDKIGGLLCTAKMYLNTMENDPDNSHNFFQNVSSLLDQAVNEVRAMAHGLNNQTGKKALTSSIIELFALLNRCGRTVYKYYLPETFEINNPAVSEEIFLIVRELLLNVDKHAGANHCKLIIRQCAGFVKIIVTDDGNGIHIKDRNKGIGTQLIQSRVSKMNGSLSINSNLGMGTYISVSLNIKYGLND